ncbi:hypothetical protein [Nocardia iowensis]|uniref:Uncharacterized protein n=1 Tax=Nocardia iowensis TaxID=204891 RepID=A0ABX8RKZ1_NOCIO|nr:hypothetical protein [Nocardia iowensis]QXN90269.1 hypothetical protein KV110_33395 [Nocardia iowensis]
MDYDATDNELDLAVDIGEDTHQMLQQIVELGADYWRTRSHRRTGHNASSVIGYVDPGHGHQFGVVYAYSRYARYREQGTHNDAAEHVMADLVHIIEGT